MRIAVWDTYVRRPDGAAMHFDILVPEQLTDTSLILNYGQNYLGSKGFAGAEISFEKCKFCHVEQATQEIIHSIEIQGYFIVELSGCD